MKKLNLASGRMYLDGYTNVDNKSMWGGDFPVDLEADVKTLEQEVESVDEILLSHFMMYIDTLEAPVLFRKWYKWLKPGGTFIIETGDLKKIAATVLGSSDSEVINGTNGVMQLFGWDTTKGHTWAWCADTIVPLLEEVGFKVTDVRDGGLHNRPERDVIITAQK